MRFARISILLSLLACEANNLPPEELLLVARVLNTDELAYPSDVLVVGEYIVVLDATDEQPIKVYAAEGGAAVHKMGAAGEGPGEFRGAQHLLRDRWSDNHFWVYDLQLRRMSRGNLAAPGGIAAIDSIILLRTQSTTYSPEWLDDSTLIVLGFFESGRYARLSDAGEVEAFVGGIPGDGAPPSVRQHAYQGFITVHPDGRQFAIANRHAGRVELWAGGLDSPVLADVPNPFDPPLNVRLGERGPIFTMPGDEPFGYVGATSSRRGVYALYSGRSRNDSPAAAYSGTEVHVFDWGGKLIGHLRLDIPVVTVQISRDEGTLYALIIDPEPALVSFDLLPVGES